MQNFFTAIAASPTLQAVTILITLGGFGIFLAKLAGPFVRFLSDWINLGLRKAKVKRLKSILREVREDARDIRLIISSITYHALSVCSGIFILLSLAIGTIQLSLPPFSTFKAVDNSHAIPPLFVALVAVVAVPASLGISWLIFSPFFRLRIYCRLLHRHILRNRKTEVLR
jgi:hypothetical protein